MEGGVGSRAGCGVRSIFYIMAVHWLEGRARNTTGDRRDSLDDDVSRIT